MKSYVNFWDILFSRFSLEFISLVRLASGILVLTSRALVFDVNVALNHPLFYYNNHPCHRLLSRQTLSFISHSASLTR